jgi:hypothetical protein
MVWELGEPDSVLQEAARETAAITGDDPDDLARRAVALDLAPVDTDEGTGDSADY